MCTQTRGRRGLVALAVLVSGLGSCRDRRPAASEPRTLTYFVAAEPVEWNYAPLGRDRTFDRPLPEPWGERLVYPKLRYIQYTDESFTTKVRQPAWLGIPGAPNPTARRPTWTAS